MVDESNNNDDNLSSDKEGKEIVPVNKESRALVPVDEAAQRNLGALACPEDRAHFIQKANSSPQEVRIAIKETLYDLEQDSRLSAQDQINAADMVTGVTRPLGPSIIAGATVAAIVATGGMAVFAAVIFAGAVVTATGEYAAGKIKKKANEESNSADRIRHISEQIRGSDNGK